MSNYLYFSLSILHFLITLLFEPCVFCIGNDIHPSRCAYQKEHIKHVILLGFIQVYAFSLQSLLDGEHLVLTQFGPV